MILLYRRNFRQRIHKRKPRLKNEIDLKFIIFLRKLQSMGMAKTNSRFCEKMNECQLRSKRLSSKKYCTSIISVRCNFSQCKILCKYTMIILNQIVREDKGVFLYCVGNLTTFIELIFSFPYLLPKDNSRWNGYSKTNVVNR